MVSGIWSSVLCVFCLIVVPAVWADDCTSYWDENDVFHKEQICEKYCCGDCSYKYCCKIKNERLTPEEQKLCPDRPVYKSSNIGLIVGITVGVFVFILIGIILICCLAPCCLIYKLCRKRSNERQTVVTHTLVHTSQPPLSPSGPQPTYGGYQTVPAYEGPPIPTAPPPSYMECTNPDYPTDGFIEGQPMSPHPPSQSNPVSHLDEHPPYNPSYAVQP